jgi:hypothetical protein
MNRGSKGACRVLPPFIAVMLPSSIAASLEYCDNERGSKADLDIVYVAADVDTDSMVFSNSLTASVDDCDDRMSRVEKCSEADMHFVHGNRPKSPSALSSFIDIKLPNSKIVSLGDDETSRVKRGSKVDLDNVYGVTSLVDPPPNS